MCFRIETNGGALWTQQSTFICHGILGICFVSEQLFALRKGSVTLLLLLKWNVGLSTLKALKGNEMKNSYHKHYYSNNWKLICAHCPQMALYLWRYPCTDSPPRTNIQPYLVLLAPCGKLPLTVLSQSIFLTLRNKIQFGSVGVYWRAKVQCLSSKDL